MKAVDLRQQAYDFSAGNPALTLDRILSDVQAAHPEKRPLFLIDESEILLSRVREGEISEAVLIYLTGLLESRRVSFCLTASPNIRPRANSAFIGSWDRAQVRDLGVLSPADARRLMVEPVEDSVTYTDGVADAIYHLTGGQPYYTELICSNTIDLLNALRRNDLRVEDLDQVVRTIIANPPPQLGYVWDQLSAQEQLALSLMSGSEPASVGARELSRIAGEKHRPMSADELEASLSSLLGASHLQRSETGEYRFTMDLFKRWIREAHPA